MKSVERKDKLNIIFAHDHRLKKYKDDFYTTGGLGDYVTSRYTNIFGQIKLICRGIETEIIQEKLSKIENPNVEVCAIKGASLFFTKEKLAIIENEVIKCDGIIARLPSVIGLWCLYYARKYKKPYLIEVVADTFGSYWYKNIFGKIVAIPFEYLVKKNVKKAEFVLYVTDDFLQKKYPNKNNICGCSDVIIECPTDDILSQRISKIEASDGIILGTLGQIDMCYKGHKYVIKAIGDLKKMGVSIKYRLAGSGDKNYLKKLAVKEGVEELVEFCGIIPHENIGAWIDNLDIYIQPSKTEGMPRAVIEAISRGCPTLVSSAGGMYELVDRSCTFNIGSIEEIKSLLLEMKKEDLKGIAKQNFIKAKEFTPETLSKKRNDFYDLFKSRVCEEICK